MAGLIKRGKTYYSVYYIGKKQKRRSLKTDCLQDAKEEIRTLESSIHNGNGDKHRPTKTPIATVVAAYIENMKTRKTASSVKRDLSCLRESFGPVCPALVIKNHKCSDMRKKRSSRNAPAYLEAACFEAVTTADVSTHIAAQVRCKGLKPKTANRYREVLTRLYNWSMKQNGIRMPHGKNPAAEVECYREGASEISYLELEEIGKQFEALEKCPSLQPIVATYIYAGLRREELCWLQAKDVDFSGGGNGVIRVRAKTVGDESWEPKTKVNRVVPISDALKAYLDRYSAPKVKGGWYFSTPTGCRWDPDNLSGELRAANAKKKLKWTCLDFRHTFGTQLASKGVSLLKISSLMGNSPEICRKHYAALIPDSLVECVEFGVPATTPAAPVPAAPAPPAEPVVEFQGRPGLRLVVNNR
jgi:integrase